MSLVLSPLLIFLSALLYGVIHSWLASLAVKAAVSRLGGSLAASFYRLGYNLFAFISLLPILALVPLLPDRRLYSIASPWEILALLGQLAGVILAALGLLQTDLWSFIGIRQALGGMPQEPARLSVKGVYCWIRHPLYTGSLMFLWFTPRMTINLFALYCAFTIYFFVGAWVEERKLLREFGETYQSYRLQTPMFLPRIEWLRYNRCRGEETLDT
mgnify:CR=1 FL=1